MDVFPRECTAADPPPPPSSPLSHFLSLPLSLSLSLSLSVSLMELAESLLRHPGFGIRWAFDLSEHSRAARRIPRVLRLAAQLAENNGRFGCATRGQLGTPRWTELEWLYLPFSQAAHSRTLAKRSRRVEFRVTKRLAIRHATKRSPNPNETADQGSAIDSSFRRSDLAHRIVFPVSEHRESLLRRQLA